MREFVLTTHVFKGMLIRVRAAEAGSPTQARNLVVYGPRTLYDIADASGGRHPPPPPPNTKQSVGRLTGRYLEKYPATKFPGASLLIF